MPDVHAIVVGGGLRGLAAGLRLTRQGGGAEVLVVEAAAQPGGSVQTQRSNGFVCELGVFAFTSAELAALLPLLQKPPTPVACQDRARSGWVFDGAVRQAVLVEQEPLSFASGCEEVVQSCRRELGNRLRLGRAVTAIEPAPPGFSLTLGGEVPAVLTSREVVLAIDAHRAGPLLAAFDPALAEVASHVAHEPRAFVWFGGLAAAAPELQGYGVLAAEQVASPLAELIFCTEVFPRRALADRCLVRAELFGPELPAHDTELIRLAERELRRWTGTRADFGFTKVHRFATPSTDGTCVECRTRLHELVARVPGLTLAP